MKMRKTVSVLLSLLLLAGVLPLRSRAARVIDDPRSDEQWALEAVNAYEAWDLMPAGARSVTVAVLDNGFRLDHEDLADNLYRDETGAVVRYDALDGDGDPAPSLHGTHVAGIVSAVTDNGRGVAGVTGNWAKILPVQVLSSTTGIGDLEQVLGGFRFVLDYAGAHPEANIRVVSLSLGVPEDLARGVEDPDAEEFAAAVNEAFEMGILTVFAAGNNSDSYDGEAYMSFPVDWSENALGVIALQRGEDGTLQKPSWSNWNMPGQRTKDLAAPGFEILSTSWESDRGSEDFGQSGYGWMSGTSQATPCVAGVAALVFAANPALTAAEVSEILCATARPLRTDAAGSGNGFTREYGWGLVDAAAAVRAAGAVLRGPSALLKSGSAAYAPLVGSEEQDAALWSWTSSDPSVATVEHGVLTGLAAGETVLTAAARGMALQKRVVVYDAAFTAGDAAVGAAAPITFSARPVRDEWRLTAERPADDGVRLGAIASRGGDETLWLLPCAAEDITVTATLISEPSVSVSCTVTAAPADLAEGAEIDVANRMWTGEAAEPEPTVRCTVTAPEEAGFGFTEHIWILERDVDFTLRWEDNGAPGTGTVVVTGIGSFTGEVRAPFSIVDDCITDGDVALDAPDAPYVFDRTEHTPAVRVQRGGEALTEGEDYRVDYADNVNAGTATVTVTGTGRFAGTVTREFSIAPAALDDVRFRSISNHPYAYGEHLRPDVEAIDERNATDDPDAENDGRYTLVKDVDFQAEYADNVDVGTATVTVTGCGNYTGTQTLTFGICDKIITANNVTTDAPEGGFVYSGEAWEPAVVVTWEGETLTEGTDYLVDSPYHENVNAGKGYIWIEPIGDYAAWFVPTVYGFGGVPVTFTIVPADLAAAEIAAPGTQYYSGGPVEPPVEARFNGAALTEGVDYTLEYADNTDVGTATVTVTGTGNFEGTAELTFEIVEGTYRDVPAYAWYAGAVDFVTARGLFEGLGDGIFAPDAPMERAMAAQVLWRMAGMPEADAPAPFADVAADDWFADAVGWAAAAGVALGDGGRFAPHDALTREQLWAMAYRFVQADGGGFAGLWAFPLDFPDADAVSDWAREGACWLVMNGVVDGADGLLDPQGVATRAQAAAVLQRLAGVQETEGERIAAASADASQ